MSYEKTLVGLGVVNYDEQVQVISVIPDKTNGKVTTALKSTADTEATHVYTAQAFVDGVYQAGNTVSWAAGDIPDGIKVVEITGLTLPDGDYELAIQVFY